MKLTATIGTALTAIAVGLTAEAASITGTTGCSSGFGEVDALQIPTGNLTTSLGLVTGTQACLSTQVEDKSGPFTFIPYDAPVVFSRPWVFNPPTSTTLCSG